MKLRIFVSYSRDDLDFADQLVAGLKTCGFDPTIDRHGIAGGEKWKSRLGALILEADTVVFVVSPSSARSEICAWEVNEAQRLGKRILPVVCSDLGGSAPPPSLRDLNYIFFYREPTSPGSGFGVGLERLVEALKLDLDWIREHTRLLQRATEWESVGRAENRLLSGGDIESAKTWVSLRRPGAPELTTLHLDYIKASEAWQARLTNEERQRLEERERLVRESEAAAREKAEAAQRAQAAIQEREAALLRVAEEQKGREQALTASARNRRLFTYATACLLALAVGIAGWASMQARATERREAIVGASLADRAIASSLAGQAMRIAISVLPTETRSPLAIGWREPEIRLVEAKLAGAAQSSGLRRELKGHVGSVKCAAFSHDGRTIVTSSSDRTVRLWDAAGGTETLQIKGHGSSVNVAAFSPGDDRVLTGSSDRSAVIWDAHSGAQLAVLKGHGRPVLGVAWNRDGSMVATASIDWTARLWNATDSALVAEFKGHTGAVTSVAIDPSGDAVLTGSADGTARIWSRSSGASVLQVGGGTETITSVAFSPDGTRFVTGSSDRTARIWSARTGDLLAQFKGHGAAVNRVDWSRDGQILVTASDDFSARVWDVETGSELVRLMGHAAPVLAASIDSSGRWIATASADQSVRLWDLTPSLGTFTLAAGSPRVVAARFVRNGDLILAARADGTITLIDAERGGTERELRTGSEIVDATLTSDGRLVATASTDNTARLWDAADGTLTREFKGHWAAVRSVRITPDDKGLVTASEDGTARLWDLATGAQLRVFKGHRAPLTSVNVSGDGKQIVTSSRDGTIRTWDLSNGKETGRHSVPGVAILDASLTEDADVVVSASADRLVRIWDRWGLRRILKGHTDAVTSVTISRRGDRMVTASDDGTVKVWDMETGAEMKQYGPLRGKAVSASFSTNGKAILASTDDGLVRLFDSTWLTQFSGEELVRRVCSERLVGAERQFGNDDVGDPALKAKLGSDACSRIGPLALAYWQRKIARLWTGNEPQPNAPAMFWEPPNPSTKFVDIAEEYLETFETVQPNLNQLDEINWYVDRLMLSRSRYETVEQETGVPWYVIGVIHGLEAGFDFRSHLHNGDNLEKRTVHVPAGRPKSGNPPFTWEESAIDALELSKLTHRTDWDLAHVLYRLELYNGIKTRTLFGRNSPYLWGCSSASVPGKFVADGVFDPAAETKQCGAAIILKILSQRGIIQLKLG